ncbi:MAG: hypothetical protein ABIS06_16770 [Vicinamibacterales bacterium]
MIGAVLLISTAALIAPAQQAGVEQTSQGNTLPAPAGYVRARGLLSLASASRHGRPEIPPVS